MFQQLSQRLSRVVQTITGQGRMTEDNLKAALAEVRTALLEADVALPVIDALLVAVKQKSLGQTITQSLQPGQQFIKNVHDELVHLMGDSHNPLNLRTQKPAVIMLAGLQGAGKTTTAAKLARWLQQKEKQSVMLTSCDIYRPAAITQLATLAEQTGSAFHASTPEDRPEDIVRSALTAARQQYQDVLIIDTAGRLHIDQDMMTEISRLHELAKPVETLFVVDSMTGQDAANTAKAFHTQLPLTGIILTKIDGDARGGAALSVKHITQKPIKFLGAGEHLDELTPFHPERIASRILGMGDIVSLAEEAQEKLDQKTAERMAKKLKKGEFDLEDFRTQIQQMQKMGGMQKILASLPGMSQIPQAALDQINDNKFKRMQVMIDSMTPHERRFPECIKGSRKRRINQGSGTDIQDLNQLLKQFKQMQKMMKKLKGGKMKQFMKDNGVKS